MKKFLTCASVTFALLAGAPVLHAQSQATQEPESSQGAYTAPAATGEANAEYKDAQLRKFVDAQNDINDIREEYMAKIEDAGSEDKARELQIEANDKMVSVIEDTGLDIPTYNAIATAYNSEPGVRDRIDAMM